MNAPITLQSLGISKEEILDRVVNQVAHSLLEIDLIDENGEVGATRPTSFAAAIQERVQQKIDAAITEIAAKNVLPNVASYVENICLQETNKWGEKSGKKLTFIEYLVQRAEHYLNEQVDFKGKTKDHDSYNWRAAQTRIAYLVHEHLQYSIDTAMKAALKDANSQIAGGLAEAVKIKLKEVSDRLKVSASFGN